MQVPYHKQNRDYTCGPACLRMVLEYYDSYQDEISITKLCGTTIAGTSLSEIANAADGFGLQATWKTSATLKDLKSAIKQARPVIAMVDARILHGLEIPIPAGHMIVIFAIEKNKIRFHDPQLGHDQQVSISNFSASWQNMRNGMVMIWQKSNP